MKTAIFLILSAATFAASASADTYVRGHTRSNGTYVAPHYRSDSNGTVNDNWSTQGNVNPYTGQPGTRPQEGGLYNPYPTQVAPPVYGARRY